MGCPIKCSKSCALKRHPKSQRTLWPRGVMAFLIIYKKHTRINKRSKETRWSESKRGNQGVGVKGMGKKVRSLKSSELDRQTDRQIENHEDRERKREPPQLWKHTQNSKESSHNLENVLPPILYAMHTFRRTFLRLIDRVAKTRGGEASALCEKRRVYFVFILSDCKSVGRRSCYRNQAQPNG